MKKTTAFAVVERTAGPPAAHSATGSAKKKNWMYASPAALTAATTDAIIGNTTARGFEMLC